MDQRVREIRELFAAGTTPPSPMQRDFPIWLGDQGPQGAERAGRLGTGLLNLNPEMLGPYRRRLEHGGHDPESARMAGLINLVVADDPDSVFERIFPQLRHPLNTYRSAASEGSGKTPRPLTEDDLRTRRKKPGAAQAI